MFTRYDGVYNISSRQSVHSKPINESEYGNKVRIIHQDLVIESGSSWGSADEPYFGHNGRTNFPYEQPSG